jgi:hypothetical protein
MAEQGDVIAQLSTRFAIDFLEVEDDNPVLSQNPH